MSRPALLIVDDEFNTRETLVEFLGRKFDVSGAGDTVIAASTLTLSVLADPVSAAEIANYAAGVVVGKLGTATVSAEELLAVLGS